MGTALRAVRALLIQPPSPERLVGPLLGFQHVAAALLRAGCEVRVIDAAARHFRGGADAMVATARAFRPGFIGIALHTRWVGRVYRLAQQLREAGCLLVAGGPHATVCPHEPLAHGFDVVLSGEVERSIVAFVQALAADRPLADVPGIHWRTADGQIRSGPSPEPIADLDGLPPAHAAAHLFDPSWYGADRSPPVAGGVLASRGCRARCTFCANAVTGRQMRYRSPSAVCAELTELHHRTGRSFFAFWDDALTADQGAVLALADAFQRELPFALRFSAITRANQVTPDLLKRLRAAGLMHVNFGIESGDDAVLRAIRKGLRTEQVVRALDWAKAAGLQTTCNFMLGFPYDTPQTLENTLRFMERIAPQVDNFSTLGVVVPFPGTPLYDLHHRHYGFTEWWLRTEYGHPQAWEDADEPVGPADAAAAARFAARYCADDALGMDFFRYDTSTRQAIEACLRFKGEHNLRRMGIVPNAAGEGCGRVAVAA